uniref:Uncharacterized protein n=1 Tax=Rhizophagus irregularis (strain DAOM 181602 / DAOM 197198 / MUCL 43194) TaxID=747089 RepID=U9T638_RHIID
MVLNYTLVCTYKPVLNKKPVRRKNELKPGCIGEDRVESDFGFFGHEESSLEDDDSSSSNRREQSKICKCEWDNTGLVVVA